jgi:hypothetical protein
MKKIFYVTCVSFFLVFQAKAYKVSSLSATYKNGQVFLTWTNPAATNLKYRVYRSTTPITSGTQLNSSNLLGYVLDNSGKNIRKSNLKGTSTYYTIDETAGPLASNKGLYVVTCTDNQTWYYAVTVENLSTGSEVKNMTPGKNCLTAGVQEMIAPVQPILQSTVNDNSGDVIYEFVVYGDNRSNSYLPAFNNCGSYGYNFSYISHVSGNAPLYVLFRDTDPFGHITPPDNCGDVNSLLMDDWLPNGQNTYWFGYHENYDMYGSSNPVFTEGIVKGYTMARVKWMIEWVTGHYGLDATRVYSSGFSHNGFGAILTGIIYPDLVAATWANVAPILMKALKGSIREKMWCANGSNLLTDIPDPNTGSPIPIWTLFDFRQMLRINNHRGVPFFGGINGKNDVTVGWVQYFSWYDSVEVSRQGGLWFWDQRNHNGNGKNFTSDEATLEYSRFSTARSYPAFSYCSINQDPGNSNTSTGDPYGALNAYLDWDDNSINDNNCSYSITCRVKDMYVNGVLQTSYDSCTTDITLRRLQNFHPTIGATINWNVKNSDDEVVQSGSFIYDGEPPVIYGAKIYRSGSTITFDLQNCFGKAEAAATRDEPFEVKYAKDAEGYRISVDVPESTLLRMRLISMNGQTHDDITHTITAGRNEFSLKAEHGIYLLHLQCGNSAVTKKLFF